MNADQEIREMALRLAVKTFEVASEVNPEAVVNAADTYAAWIQNGTVPKPDED